MSIIKNYMHRGKLPTATTTMTYAYARKTRWLYCVEWTQSP